MQSAFLQAVATNQLSDILIGTGVHRSLLVMHRGMTILLTLSRFSSCSTVTYIPAGAARDRLGDASLQERRCSNAEASTSVGAFELIELSVSSFCCQSVHSPGQRSHCG